MTNAVETKTIRCPRCGGSGEIEAFRHVASGVCFLCDGEGAIEACDIAKVAGRGIVLVMNYDDTRNAASDATCEGRPVVRQETISIMANPSAESRNQTTLWAAGWVLSDENREALRALWLAVESVGGTMQRGRWNPRTRYTENYLVTKKGGAS